MITVSFYLIPTPPFRLDLTVWALRRMPHNEIDRWNGSTYARVLALGGSLVKLEVSQPDPRRISVEVTAEASRLDVKQYIVPLIEKLLGIRTDLGQFYRFAGQNGRLRGLAQDFLGFKPPRFPFVYEAVINAVACQQISLNVAILLLDRITKAWGRPWPTGPEQLHAFPLPGDLAKASVSKLRGQGFSTSKARTLIAVSELVGTAGFDLERLVKEPDAEVLTILTQLPGIGPWSAEYVMLRGLGRTHIFPGDDSGAQRSLQLLLALKERPDAVTTAELTHAWHPHAGLLYFHFLLKKLRSKGYFR